MKSKLFVFLAVIGFAIAVASCSGQKSESTSSADSTKVDTAKVAVDSVATNGKDSVSTK